MKKILYYNDRNSEEWWDYILVYENEEVITGYIIRNNGISIVKEKDILKNWYVQKSMKEITEEELFVLLI